MQFGKFSKAFADSDTEIKYEKIAAPTEANSSEASEANSSVAAEANSSEAAEANSSEAAEANEAKSSAEAASNEPPPGLIPTNAISEELEQVTTAAGSDGLLEMKGDRGELEPATREEPSCVASEASARPPSDATLLTGADNGSHVFSVPEVEPLPSVVKSDSLLVTLDGTVALGALYQSSASADIAPYQSVSSSIQEPDQREQVSEATVPEACVTTTLQVTAQVSIAVTNDASAHVVVSAEEYEVHASRDTAASDSALQPQEVAPVLHDHPVGEDCESCALRQSISALPGVAAFQAKLAQQSVKAD